MIRGTLRHEMDAFDKAMGQYIGLSKRSVAETVAQKGGQLIMGNQSPPFPGLYHALRDLTPPEGSITRERLAEVERLPRGGSRRVKVRRRARQRAEQMLEGRPSGLFSITERGGGRLNVRQVRFRKRGDKRITNRSNRGGVVRVSRRREAASGEVLLNRISLGIALELMYREQGRGYIAISFLPKRYRQMLGRVRASTRRNAQAYRQRKVEMNKALQEGVGAISSDQVMRNATGQVLGRLYFQSDSQGQGAAMRITGFTPPQRRAEASQRAANVVSYVRADTMTYIARKLERNRADVGKFGGNVR